MLYIVSSIKLYSIIDFQDFWKEYIFCTENNVVLRPQIFMRGKTRFVLHLLFQRMQTVA